MNEKNDAKPPAPKFVPASVETLRAWAWKLRHAHVECERAANAWRVRNDELNAYVAQNNHLFNQSFTKRDFKGQDFELSDAMAQINFWDRELKRIQALITAEESLRDMLRRDYYDVPR